MITVTIGSTPITIQPTVTTLQPGDRIYYIPLAGAGQPWRPGTFIAPSGVSAFVRLDHLGWVSAAPLERLEAMFPYHLTECP